jgi:hypothetical protein
MQLIELGTLGTHALKKKGTDDGESQFDSELLQLGNV